MTIKFIEDTTNGYLEWYAISTLAIHRGKAHDELLWAEIRRIGPDKWRVVWEDDFSNPVWKKSLSEAKQYVLDNYEKHAPHINGSSFNIDEL